MAHFSFAPIPFPPEPPATALADPRPFCCLWHHQFWTVKDNQVIYKGEEVFQSIEEWAQFSQGGRRKRKNSIEIFFDQKTAQLQSWTKVLGTVLQYSYFSVISRFPLKTVHPFRNFLVVLPPPHYKKLKLGKNSGYTRPTLFAGPGEELGLCELENAEEMQKCPKTFVHDCRIMIQSSTCDTSATCFTELQVVLFLFAWFF